MKITRRIRMTCPFTGPVEGRVCGHPSQLHLSPLRRGNASSHPQRRHRDVLARPWSVQSTPATTGRRTSSAWKVRHTHPRSGEDGGEGDSAAVTKRLRLVPCDHAARFFCRLPSAALSPALGSDTSVAVLLRTAGSLLCVRALRRHCVPRRWDQSGTAAAMSRWAVEGVSPSERPAK